MEKHKVINKILFVILFCEILFWISINTCIKFIRDFDFSNLLYHTIKMWETKKFVLPDWTYVSTGEWDCSSLLAMSLYGVMAEFIEVYPETYYNKETCLEIIDFARENNIQQVIFYNDSEWPQILRGYAPDIDFITYCEEEACFQDLDVYNGTKSLDCFLRKSMVMSKNGVTPSLDGYTDGYEYKEFIGQFRIFIN